MSDSVDDVDSLLRAVAAAPARPRPAPGLTGTTIAQYRIAEVIGRGGMGVVYRAEDTQLQRTVAIKVLQTGLSDDPAQRERFLREARSAAAITHANIVTIHEVGEHDGHVFLVMELVRGATLAERIARGPLPPAEATRIATGVARGLARAHANKIVHRDIKPSNIMLDADGEPKILDFGIAKLRATEGVSGTGTTQGTIIGTPQYMSPEQARGASVDERSDVFSFGVVLYEMLAGRSPFVHDSFSETVAAIMRDPHPPLRDAPSGLARIVDRCLAKAPQDRYASAGDALEALTTSPARPRMRWRWIAVAAIACACAAAAFVLSRRTDHATSRARAITEWPAPRTASHEAAAAYGAALQALRDASFTAADRHLGTAIRLDPHFAAARLRLLLLDGAQSEPMRQALNVALEDRERLDARDQRLLALVQTEARGSGAGAVTADARALAAERPDDAEAQLWAAVALTDAGDPAGGEVTMSHALAIDPHFAAAEAFRAIWAESTGDLDRMLASAKRCLAITPSATTCLRRQMVAHAMRGNCTELADDTRELVLREPESDVNFENRITALAAQGAPADALRELAHKAEALVEDPAAAHALAAANAARIALYEGDFETAEAKFLELEQLTPPSSDESAHFIEVYPMGLYEEEGDPAKALAAASTYLRRRPAWIHDDNGFPRAFALAIEHRYHALGDADFTAQRAAWLAEDQHFDRTWLWVANYAWPAMTPAEAHDAVAALPSYEPLSFDQLGYGHAFAAARAFVLVGDVDRALPLLRHVTAWCGATIDGSAETSAIGWQLIIIQSHLYLGLALEQRGDRAGACAEYARVLVRWGHAKPKSTTADRARERATALGCATTEAAPRSGSAGP